MADQVQKSGDNSSQVMAEVINNYYVGINEKRAREICMEVFNTTIRKELTDEARILAEQRVEKLENILIPKMQIIDNALDEFSNPDFQILLSSAHKTAISTERLNDYDRLSELLIKRVKVGKDRKYSTAIKKAIEVLDEVSDEGLLALSVYSCTHKIRPTCGEITQGLNVLENMYGKIINNDTLPGHNWIENLDTLNVIRIQSFLKLSGLIDSLAEYLSGYCCTGIKKDTKEYVEAHKLLYTNLLPNSILIDHELNEGYVRLSLTIKGDYSNKILVTHNQEQKQISIPLSKEQCNCLEQIEKMYDKNTQIVSKVKNRLVAECNNRKNIREIDKWINSFPVGFTMTNIAYVLGYSNAKKHYADLPEFI